MRFSEARFQFHSGSIKSFCSRFVLGTALLFQFHSGSIKSGCASGCASTASAWFQFHSGSIKSHTCILTPVLVNWFQFHSGSIKRATF